MATIALVLAGVAVYTFVTVLMAPHAKTFWKKKMNVYDEDFAGWLTAILWPTTIFIAVPAALAMRINRKWERKQDRDAEGPSSDPRSPESIWSNECYCAECNPKPIELTPELEAIQTALSLEPETVGVAYEAINFVDANGNIKTHHRRIS